MHIYILFSIYVSFIYSYDMWTDRKIFGILLLFWDECSTLVALWSFIRHPHPLQNSPNGHVKQDGEAGNLLNTMANFLNDRKEKVVPNGEHSTLVNDETGVPQCSIFGPLTFSIYTWNSSRNRKIPSWKLIEFGMILKHSATRYK